MAKTKEEFIKEVEFDLGKLPETVIAVPCDCGYYEYCTGWKLEVVKIKKPKGNGVKIMDA